MEQKSKDELIQQIAQAVCGLKYHEWCRIRNAIEKKYTSELAKAELHDPEALARMIALDW